MSMYTMIVMIMIKSVHNSHVTEGHYCLSSVCVCVCVCVRACVRACMRACVCACVCASNTFLCGCYLWPSISRVLQKHVKQLKRVSPVVLLYL